MNDWISVYDDLPEEMQMVVVIANNAGPNGNYTTDPWCAWIQRDGLWCSRWPHDVFPTHWMPIPAAPTLK